MQSRINVALQRVEPYPGPLVSTKFRTTATRYLNSRVPHPTSTASRRQEAQSRCGKASNAPQEQERRVRLNRPAASGENGLRLLVRLVLEWRSAADLVLTLTLATTVEQRIGDGVVGIRAGCMAELDRVGLHH
jgi:hypothetical protein